MKNRKVSIFIYLVLIGLLAAMISQELGAHNRAEINMFGFKKPTIKVTAVQATTLVVADRETCADIE